MKSKEVDGMVTAGHTGATVAATKVLVRTLPGVDRPALAASMPAQGGRFLVVDAGANTNVDENNLVQFAQMGSIYMNCVMGMENPRVGLINNGSEETKGSELTQAVYQRLKEMPDLNFVGNLEGRDVPFGRADVMTCDGFTGNVVLKTMEGMAKVIMEMLQEEVYASTRGKVGGMLLKPSLRNLKKKMDYAEYGGAPLLGVNGVSVVCHGSSKARAIFKAIEVANTCCESRFVEKIKGKYETKSEQ